MGLYNFKAQFVSYVLDGSKRHTIRAIRKHPDKPGNTLHLYRGLRTKNSRLLMRSKCLRIEDIVITERHTVLVDAVLLGESECNELAWRDGFRDGPKDEAFFRMMQFWDGRLPFVGHIIHWGSPLATESAATARISSSARSAAVLVRAEAVVSCGLNRGL